MLVNLEVKIAVVNSKLLLYTKSLRLLLKITNWFPTMQNNILVTQISLCVLIANNLSIIQSLEKVSKKLKIPEKESI